MRFKSHGDRRTLAFKKLPGEAGWLDAANHHGKKGRCFSKLLKACQSFPGEAGLPNSAAPYGKNASRSLAKLRKASQARQACRMHAGSARLFPLARNGSLIGADHLSQLLAALAVGEERQVAEGHFILTTHARHRACGGGGREWEISSHHLSPPLAFATECGRPILYNPLSPALPNILAT